MKAEIWSEITCLRCGLGSHRLDRAVERSVMAKYGAIPEQADAPDIEGMAPAEGTGPGLRRAHTGGTARQRRPARPGRHHGDLRHRDRSRRARYNRKNLPCLVPC